MFRFSIRDIFWGTLVVAMGLGWWLSLDAMNARCIAAIKQSQKFRSVLLDAQQQCKSLELDEKWVFQHVSGNISYVSPNPHVDVNWSVLDEPIPSP